MNLEKANKPLSYGFVLLAVGTCPLIYERAFGLFALSGGEAFFLWTLSLCFLLLSFRLFTSPIKNRSTAVFFFVTLTLLSTEYFTRFLVKRVLPEKVLRSVSVHGIMAYPERWRYRGHPFSQFTGNPNFLFEGNWVNNSGFYGPSRPYKKPKNVIRVVTLGASSSRHYPSLMEKELNKKLSKSTTQFEVINLSLDSYSSMHSVVNWVTHGVEYEPDYVVFHHAPASADLSPDYSNVFKTFEPTVPLDATFIRASVVYRELRNLIVPLKGWYFFNKSVLHNSASTDNGPPTRGLLPYQRNIKTILDVAKGRGVVTVLTTHPHSTNTKHRLSENPHLTKGAELVRKVYEQSTGTAILVDLAKEFPKDVFIDLSHVNQRGDELKAKAISEAIWHHHNKHKKKPQNLS